MLQLPKTEIKFSGNLKDAIRDLSKGQKGRREMADELACWQDKNQPHIGIVTKYSLFWIYES
jgi:hypothetical protein